MTSDERILKNVDAVATLAKRLEQCPAVSQHDSGEEKEAWTLADSLADIEEASRAFLDEHLPKLVNENVRGEELLDVLLDIGEEFRTILYHIRDPKFYRYLEEET